MTAGSESIAAFYRGWDAYQARLVTAIQPLSADQLDSRAAPHLWSLRILAAHVVATRVWWFHAWMGEGPADLEEMQEWDEDARSELRSAPELVTGLERTWEVIDGCLQRWTVDDLSASFIRPRADAQGERPRRTRQWIIWHLLEHDLHHGGEISFTLGIHGLAGVGL